MIEISAKQLYEAFRAVKHTEWSTLPALNYALITLTDDGLTCTTCTLANNEKGKDIKKSDPVRYYANGERWQTCVPLITKTQDRARNWHKFYPFLDWLRVMAEYRETLTIAFDPAVQILTVRAGSSTTEFKCLDACEFPPC